ncbi:MAG TPA: glycosyltransferase [Paludibacteraceae bacterium]|nr:glycosyltransferase [Paludibacteraceae bacterium]HPQ12547.1 glycosyltransferase [Paludibacteraceae bacterium]HRT81372.1 glycosyltransferase [Bacteroidales bacterium]
MENALITVLMTTFNEPVEYIQQSIESVLNQTYANFELLILDDSSNEDAIQAIDSFKRDNRVSVVRDKQRMGFVNALNKGMKMAKGEYIARMDADDICFNDRFEKQINFMQTHSDVDILGGNMKIIDENGIVVSQRQYPCSKFSLKFSSVFRSPVAHPTVMFRRSIIEKNMFYDDLFKKAEDLEFWLRLRNNGFKIANMPEYVLYFRISGDLAKKRNSEHFSYSFRARSKNFSWRYFYLDIPSILFAKLYSIVPSKITSIYYLNENKNMKNGVPKSKKQ